MVFHIFAISLRQVLRLLLLRAADRHAPRTSSSWCYAKSSTFYAVRCHAHASDRKSASSHRLATAPPRPRTVLDARHPGHAAALASRSRPPQVAPQASRLPTAPASPIDPCARRPASRPRTRLGVTGASRASSASSASRCRPPASDGSSPPPAATGLSARPGRSSCAPRPRRSSPATSSPSNPSASAPSTCSSSSTSTPAKCSSAASPPAPRT